MESIGSNNEHYYNAFRAYIERADRFDKMSEICENILPPYITRNIGSIPVFRFLGVACGTGENELIILKRLRQQFPSVHATIVETSHDMMKTFKANVDLSKDDLDGVTFECKTMTYEEYQGKHTGELFHCITVFGAITYFDSPTIGSFLSYLHKDGVFVIGNGSDDNIFRNLLKQFPQIYREETLKFKSEIQNALDKTNEITIDEVPGCFSFDISECFDSESRDGNLCLDLLTHIVNFRQTAPPNLFADVMQFLKDANISKNNKDKVVVCSSWYFAIVRKI